MRNLPTSRFASLALLPAALGLSAALMACDPASPEKETLEQALVGQWFPCESVLQVPGGNAECKWVDDDGLRIEAGGKISGTDGAYPENPSERDSNRVKDTYFDITIGKIVGYREENTTFTVKGDTLFIDERECAACPAEMSRNVASIEGDILTIKPERQEWEPIRYRRYKGSMRLVTEAEFHALAGGVPE
jgi:hypothetical protein